VLQEVGGRQVGGESVGMMFQEGGIGVPRRRLGAGRKGAMGRCKITRSMDYRDARRRHYRERCETTRCCNRVTQVLQQGRKCCKT